MVSLDPWRLTATAAKPMRTYLAEPPTCCAVIQVTENRGTSWYYEAFVTRKLRPVHLADKRYGCHVSRSLVTDAPRCYSHTAWQVTESDRQVKYGVSPTYSKLRLDVNTDGDFNISRYSYNIIAIQGPLLPKHGYRRHACLTHSCGT